jgi:hypothetical protein
MTLFEEQMYQGILSFMEKEGYWPFVQVPLLAGNIDFVGIRDSECLVIESKVDKWKSGLKQALAYGYGAEKAYVALPAPTAKYVACNFGAMFEKYSVGIIEVSDKVNVILDCEGRTPSNVFKQLIFAGVEERKRKRDYRLSEFRERLRE